MYACAVYRNIITSLYQKFILSLIYAVSESATIGLILGSVSFILMVGIVLVLICICYYIKSFHQQKEAESYNM